ncbi:glycosyl transferase family 1 [Desulfuromonas versatilis]|uniref:Glycosyl transferase family 1 n=1 Tax=Desulfuromonas versatilis TaxID=2802975 RepID=A0ABN6DZA6_9BACT|nr:glycosyltransferase [Desulfuromonas versatilis]BCR05279.1 glycosyl transferase family 1 [Desulfuromonas versatilis]
MKIKVLHVTLGLHVGGLEKFVLDLVFALGLTVDAKIVCLEEAGGLARALDVKDVFEIGKTPGLRLGIIAELAKIVKREKIDIIHTHNPAPHFYGSLAGLVCGVPVVHTKHGRNCPTHKKKVWLNRISSALTKMVVTVSEDSALVCREIEKIPKGKVRTILNGINTEVFSPKGERRLLKSLGIDDATPVVGTVARLVPEKDHITLLKACLVLTRAGHKFRLMLVGDGPMRQELEDFVAKEGLDEVVMFMGTRHDVPQLVPEFDVFTLTSRTEGVSLTLLEAMSCQIPIIATDVGGNPEVVSDSVTGFIVPAGQYEAVADKISTLLRDPDLRKRMGQAGRERVLGKFGIEGAARQYLEIYQAVLRPK